MILLLLSCLFSALLLWNTDPRTATRLTSASQVDSLITLTLSDFNISEQRIRTQTVATDTVFSRKVHTVRVSSDFSKTSFHYQLHKNLAPFNVSTYGVVQFPEKHLRIHMMYNETVHRTLVLQTDPLLNLTPNP